MFSPPPLFFLSATRMSVFHMYVSLDHSVEMGRGCGALAIYI